jgi:hypothetical protein
VTTVRRHLRSIHWLGRGRPLHGAAVGSSSTGAGHELRGANDVIELRGAGAGHTEHGVLGRQRGVAHRYACGSGSSSKHAVMTTPPGQGEPPNARMVAMPFDEIYPLFA